MGLCFKLRLSFLILFGLCSTVTIVVGTEKNTTVTSVAIKGVPSGYFSVYLLALDWWPEYCTQINDYNCSNLYGGYTATHLGLHGLWPQYYRIPPTYPTYCLDSPGGENFDKNQLTQATWNQYVSLVPVDAEELAAHQWNKHGTCSGLTQEQYFNKTIKGAINMPGTPMGLQDYIGRSLSYDKLSSFFGGENMVQLNCNYHSDEQKYYFLTAITIWDKNTGVMMANPGFVSTCPKDKPIYIRSVPQRA